MRSRAKTIRRGTRFGQLTVLCREGSIRKHAAFRCRCLCGNEVVVRGINLRRGEQRSCGQKHRNRALINLVALKEQNIYTLMLLRCYDSTATGYKNYGAKGVKVCDRWRLCFENFLSDMGPRPSPEHSIDRYPDPAGNYEPGNCRWATRLEQARNKRRTMFVEIEGRRIPLVEHLTNIGVSRYLIYKRLKRGWTMERAIGIPSSVRQQDASLLGVKDAKLVKPDIPTPAWKDPTGWEM